MITYLNLQAFGTKTTMNYNDIYLMKLLKASIYDVAIDPPEKSVDCQYIYNKSVEQNISGLVYNAIKKSNIIIDNNIEKMWKDSMMSSFIFAVKQSAEFNKIINFILSENINFSVLKGCILRNFYPVPELRTMGDFDILVKKESIQTLRQIFTNNGYNIKNDYVGIICEKNNIVWEIFYSLEEEFKENTNYWDAMFMKENICINNLSCPSETLFFIHLIVHTGKHLISEGAGIRNLCDIALFLNKYEKKIDFDVVEMACKEQGYYKIYCHLINAVAEWFDADIYNINIPKTNTEKFIEYMLLNGIFGKHGNTVFSQLTKVENKDDSIGKKLFFPSVNALKHRYKYLNNYPYLLPVAWIHRFFSAIFKRKFSVSRMSKDVRSALKYSETREKWLKELNLID